jgi:hypothetical protein
LKQTDLQLGLMHLTCIKIGALKTCLEFLHEGTTLRIKAIHVLNANYATEKMLAVAKLFMKSDLLTAVRSLDKWQYEVFYLLYILDESVSTGS